MKARIFIMYGQFGWLTSIGMANLAKRLTALYPQCEVTTHSWKYPSVIEMELYRLDAKLPKIVIGYSLGANSVTIVAANAHQRPIDLAVCYDPSVSGVVVQPTANIKRLLLYHNQGSGLLGHLIFHGPQVERTDVNQTHLGVCFNESLHLKTIAEIGLVIA